MLGHQFAFSTAPIRKVKEVQFGILSPEEIVRAESVRLLRVSDHAIESLLCRQNRTSRSHGRNNAQAKDGWIDGSSDGHHRQEFQVSDVW